MARAKRVGLGRDSTAAPPEAAGLGRRGECAERFTHESVHALARLDEDAGGHQGQANHDQEVHQAQANAVDDTGQFGSGHWNSLVLCDAT